MMERCEFAAAECHPARAFHVAIPIVKAMSAKNTPVTCSHTTLENRTTGVTIELFACFPAALTVCTSGMPRGTAEGRLSTGRLNGLLAVGFGALAASAACASVLAACRAPYPNARPNLTRSIAPVYVWRLSLVAKRIAGV